jgi:hypothetical protein
MRGASKMRTTHWRGVFLFHSWAAMNEAYIPFCFTSCSRLYIFSFSLAIGEPDATMGAESRVVGDGVLGGNTSFCHLFFF